MNIHLEEDIQEMLYENGSVVIPGVGAFKGNYKSAYIDGVQGHLAPPSLDITFDPNSLINDGVFVDFLKKKYQISLQEAQNAIDIFAKGAINTFEKHELVVIPQVGRLYRDFNHRIQFLPDTTNFNTDTFGLPAAQFYPVSRTIVEKTAVVEAIKNDAPPPPIIPTQKFPESTTDIPYPVIDTREADEEEPVKWRKIVPALTTAVLFILAFSIYMHNQSKEKEGLKSEKPKVNVSPSKPEGTAPAGNNPPPTPPIASTKQPDTKTIANEKMLKNGQNTEGGSSAIVPPVRTALKENKARIICGAFGDANNINRHKKWFAATVMVFLKSNEGQLQF